MSSFIKELINPKTGKKQKAFCIDDYYGSHKYGYGFLKDGGDADFTETLKYQFIDCDFYKAEELK